MGLPSSQPDEDRRFPLISSIISRTSRAHPMTIEASLSHARPCSLSMQWQIGRIQNLAIHRLLYPFGLRRHLLSITHADVNISTDVDCVKGLSVSEVRSLKLAENKFDMLSGSNASQPQKITSGKICSSYGISDSHFLLQINLDPAWQDFRCTWARR